MARKTKKSRKGKSHKQIQRARARRVQAKHGRLPSASMLPVVDLR